MKKLRNKGYFSPSAWTEYSVLVIVMVLVLAGSFLFISFKSKEVSITQIQTQDSYIGLRHLNTFSKLTFEESGPYQGNVADALDKYNSLSEFNPQKEIILVKLRTLAKAYFGSKKDVAVFIAVGASSSDYKERTNIFYGTIKLEKQRCTLASQLILPSSNLEDENSLLLFYEVCT